MLPPIVHIFHGVSEIIASRGRMRERGWTGAGKPAKTRHPKFMSRAAPAGPAKVHSKRSFMKIAFAKPEIPTSGTLVALAADGRKLGKLAQQLDKSTKGAIARA